MPTVPVDSAIRGRLRLWRASAAQRGAALNRAFDSNATGAAVDSLFFKGAVGRARALRRLRLAFEGLGARWTGTPEAPRWSWINPAFDLFGDPPVISMGCIWADRSGAALFSRPIWCLAVSEHACARFFQRSPPDASLDDALFEGHANVLHLSTTCLIERKKAGAALIIDSPRARARSPPMSSSPTRRRTTACFRRCSCTGGRGSTWTR